MASQKQNYHIDETYSYILSNSYDTDRLANSDILWNRWVSSDEWEEFTTVQKGEQFAYASVYWNNTTDAHPPLFYWCLHTVCSFFPDSFSKWYGIGMNTVFFALSLVVLFFISRRLIRNQWLSLLPVIIWGFSPLAADTTVFIRMYALLTFLTLCSILMHIKMYQDGQSWGKLAATFFITFLGAMTQYYFIVAAFCMSATYCIYLLTKKEYKKMLVYGVLEMLAIALLFVAYPAAVSQITGSSTNNIGNEVSSTFFTVSGWGITIVKYIYLIITGWGAGLLRVKYVTCAFMAAMAALILAVLIKRHVAEKHKELPVETADGVGKEDSSPKNISHATARNGNEDRKIRKKKMTRITDNRELLQAIVLALSVLAAITIISKLSYTYVYTRYMYHIAPVAILAAVMVVEWLADRLSLKMEAVCVVLLCFSLLNAASAVAYNINSYLFQDRQEQYESLMDEYGDIPIVLLCENSTYVLTSNYHLLKNYSNVYVTSAANTADLEEILQEKDTDSGVLLFIWTDTEWADGYDGESVLAGVTDSCPSFEYCEFIINMNFCDIYYLD